MGSLVFRLLVLLLAVLLQVGSLRAQASASASAISPSAPALGDFDVPEEDASAVDDVFDGMLAAGFHPGCVPAPSERAQGAAVGLPAGGPPLDAPFKPPRA